MVFRKPIEINPHQPKNPHWPNEEDKEKGRSNEKNQPNRRTQIRPQQEDNKHQILTDHPDNNNEKEIANNKSRAISKQLTKWNDTQKKQLRIRRGERCLNIPSLHMDSLRNTKELQWAYYATNETKIDISRIQETTDTSTTIYDYRG